jgi:cytochrome c oxidase subunit 2
MPPLVRRKPLLVGLLAFVVALATAGVAAAAGGGFQPQNPHSPETHHINTAYWVIFAFTTAIFLIVVSALVVFVIRYRSRGRGRAAEGFQVHGNTRLELIWTVIPVVILAIIGAVVFLELPKITTPAKAADTLEITVEGHQFYWQFDYPNGARTINTLYVPVGRNVRFTVISGDVIHSFWVPQLQGKIQAIPGRTNHTGFKADRAGTYYGYCGLICGPFHAKMLLTVEAVDPSTYESTVQQNSTPQALGKQEFTGICATCHGMQGEGGYGPALSANSILTQRSALASIVRNGRGLMPPVGDTWTNAQIDALAQYTKSHVYKGAGATSGG